MLRYLNSMDEKEIKQKLEKGYILSRVIIEVVGKPKEYIDDALEKLVAHARNNKMIAVLKEHKEEAQEIKTDTKNEKGMYGAFAELEILLENFNLLVSFCFEYMPSSVEILEPTEFKFKSREIASVLNEIQAKLHTLGINIKNLKNENLFLKQNSSKLLLNYLTILLVNHKRTLSDLSKLTTISEQELKPFVKQLTESGKVKEEDGTYTFAEK